MQIPKEESSGADPGRHPCSAGDVELEPGSGGSVRRQVDQVVRQQLSHQDAAARYQQLSVRLSALRSSTAEATSPLRNHEPAKIS
jgi:hypothetical protein